MNHMNQWMTGGMGGGMWIWMGLGVLVVVLLVVAITKGCKSGSCNNKLPPK